MWHSYLVFFSGFIKFIRRLYYYQYHPREMNKKSDFRHWNVITHFFPFFRHCISLTKCLHSLLSEFVAKIVLFVRYAWQTTQTPDKTDSNIYANYKHNKNDAVPSMISLFGVTSIPLRLSNLLELLHIFPERQVFPRGSVS